MAPATVSAVHCSLIITLAKARGSLKSPSMTTPETTDWARAICKEAILAIKKKSFFMSKIKK